MNLNFCNNCGKHGHTYQQCRKPITSIGLILYRVNNNNNEYLLIRRKDSLGYVDFLRGKYSIYNKNHIINIINEMTIYEKDQLLNNNFDMLWNKLWGEEMKNQYKNEYKSSYEKFNLLKEGININFNNSHDSYNLNDLIDSSTTLWNEPEWGFPKGRREVGEKDFECAMREFEEETGYNRENIKLVQNIIPLEENFIGSNYKSYKHKYYLGTIDYNNTLTYNYQKTEVSKMIWGNINECKCYLRPYNLEKINIINNINNILNKYTFC